ncbi:MAG: DUF2807 domain-containing protein [Bacteroidetes bacterium]|nr:DUF2807 domain-containing protein [Bacteroidota bacterium]
MKTSNKLLAAFLLATLLFVTWFIVSAKLHENTSNTSVLSGLSVTESRELEPFSKLTVKGRFDVILIQGDFHKLELAGDENLLPEVVTEISEGELTIKLNSNYSGKERIKLLLQMNEIEALNFSAGTLFSTGNVISGEKLALKSSSGSEGEISLNYKKLNSESSAGSSLKLEGSVDYLEISSSSGSVVEAGNLISKTCKVKSSAGSVVNVFANEEISATISSGGSLTYAGEPAITNFNTSAGGSVKRK